MNHSIRPQRPNLDPGVSAFLDQGPHGLLIGGRWRAAASGETFETRDPATGALLTSAARAGAADVDAAVDAAGRALRAPEWADMTPAARGALLWRIADLIEAHADELAAAREPRPGQERGARRVSARSPRRSASSGTTAGWPTKILGQTIPTSLSRTPPGKKVFAYTVRRAGRRGRGDRALELAACSWRR